MKRSGITRDLHSPKYRQRIVVDKRKKASKLACRKERNDKLQYECRA